MKQFIYLFLLVSVLVSCTGTPNEDIPILVIAAINEVDSVPQLVLFEDKLNSAKRFNFVANSTRELSAPAIAYDFADRTNRRDKLVVLSRDGNTASSKSFLDIFNTLAIDPSDPKNFKKTRSIDLSTIPDLPLPFCGTQIQVTRDGAYAVIFSDTTICGQIDSLRTIIILDLSKTTPEDLLLSIITPNIQGLAKAGIVLDQGNDVLYHVENGVGIVNIFRLDRNNFDDVTSSSGKHLPGKLQKEIEYDSTIGGNDFIQLVRSGSGFALLKNNSYTHVADVTTTAKITPVTTTARSQQIITDPSGNYKQIFILGENGLTIHFDADKTENVKSSDRASSITLNFLTDFLYLADQGVIKVFDLFNLDQPITSLQIDSETVPELLSKPTILTWVQGVIKAAQ